MTNKNCFLKRQNTRFSKGFRFGCIFCRGQSCKHENYLSNELQNAFQGLNSNWITDQILAMQRPSSRIIKEFNLLDQFKQKHIRAIFCLQEPGEHPFCGDKIHKSSGLSYMPEEFYESKIHFYNFGWRDHETTDVFTLIKIIKTMDYVLSTKKKVAVHCHAGKGRTALVICGYLMFKNKWSSKKTIDFFRSKRKESLYKKQQIQTLIELEHFIEKNYQDILFKERLIDFQGQQTRGNQALEQFYHEKQVYIPQLITEALLRLNQMRTEYDDEGILKAFYQPKENFESFDELFLKIKSENLIKEVFQQLESPQQIIVFLQNFFEDLKNPILKPITMQQIMFLIINHVDFEKQLMLDGMVYQKNINKDEFALLFEIHNFYMELSKYNQMIYEQSLFMWALWLFQAREKHQNLFNEQNKLIKINWDIDKKFKTFKDLFTILNKSKLEHHILRNNINIMNSPLRSFSIKRKNESILSLKNVDSFYKTEKLIKGISKSQDLGNIQFFLIHIFFIMSILDSSYHQQNKVEKYFIELKLNEQSEDCQTLEAQNPEKINNNNKIFLENFFLNLKVQKLLEIVGEENRYQYILMIILCLFNFFFAFIGFFLAYLYYEPKFFCKDSQGSGTLCHEIQACKNEFGFYIESPVKSLVTEFKLYCDKNYLKGQTQTIFIVIGGIVAFLFGSLSDRIGRKIIFQIAWIFTIIGLLIALFSKELFYITIGNTLLWAGMDVFFSMVFIYSNEIIGGKLRQKSNSIFFFFWALGEIMINVINIKITYYKTNYIIQIIPLCILGIFFYYIQESPFVLFKMKRIKKLFKVLKFIASENKKDQLVVDKQISQEFKLKQIGVNSINQIQSLKITPKVKEKNQSMIETWKGLKFVLNHEDYKWILLGSVIFIGNIYVGYGLCVLIPQSIGLSNLYLNGVFLGIAELIVQHNGYKQLLVVQQKQFFVQILLWFLYIYQKCFQQKQEVYVQDYVFQLEDHQQYLQ